MKHDIRDSISQGRWSYNPETCTVESKYDPVAAIFTVPTPPADCTANAALISYAKDMYDLIRFIANRLDDCTAPSAASMTEYTVWACYKILNAIDAEYACLTDSQDCLTDSQVCLTDSQDCLTDSQDCLTDSQDCLTDSQDAISPAPQQKSQEVEF